MAPANPEIYVAFFIFVTIVLLIMVMMRRLIFSLEKDEDLEANNGTHELIHHSTSIIMNTSNVAHV